MQGDDYVDWVGMSIYHWGNSYPYTTNEIPDARKLTSTVSPAQSSVAQPQSTITTMPCSLPVSVAWLRNVIYPSVMSANAITTGLSVL